MATLINERYRLHKEVQKLTNAIKQAKQGLNEYKDALSKRKPFADGAIPLTSHTKKTKKPTKTKNKKNSTSTAKRSSPRRAPKTDVAQTTTGTGVATKKMLPMLMMPVAMWAK
jgi:Sec-independent protein translocase protein TatA